MIPIDVNGHPILALIPIDKYKRPLVEWKQFQERLPTVEEIVDWKKRLGSKIAGWAMPTGLVTGIVALDFDGPDGVETLRNLNLIPNVETPSHGYHVWIFGPEHAVRTGAMDKRWPNMELKGDGGYVVVLGTNIHSAHKGSEPVIGDYIILNGTPLNLDELPDDLREWVSQEREKDISFAIARVKAEALEKAKDGRNNAGFWLACQLRDLGLSKVDAKKHLLEDFYDNLPRGNHEYSRRELTESLNSAYTKPEREPKESQETLPTRAIRLLQSRITDIWTDELHSYVTLPSKENLEITYQSLGAFINELIFQDTNNYAARGTVDTALDGLRAIASRGPKYAASLRVAWSDDVCYVDALDRFYAISANGISEVLDIPVKFVRTALMGSLPKVDDTGDWNLLKKYVNVLDEDWPLLRAVVLAAYMRPKGTRPIIPFMGPHGSGKSSSITAIINVTDPRPTLEGSRQSFPRDKRGLSILARHNLILSFDNESFIANQMSDALAMLSTGGQFSERTLYTDSAVSSFYGKRLVFINSIGEVVTESDLLDRSVIFQCPPLENLIDEAKLWDNYEIDRPKILRAIFDSIQIGIKNYPSLDNMKSPSRLSDFYKWAVACGIEGFEESFRGNMERGLDIALGHSFMADAILDLTRNPKESEKARERIDSAAAIMGIKNPDDYAWIGSLSSLHEIGVINSNTPTEWYRNVMQSENAYKKIRTDLRRAGIHIEEYEYMHQLWLAIRRIDYA